MKSNTLKIVFVFFLTLGITGAYAQDKAKEVKKEAPTNFKSVEKAKDQKTNKDEKKDANKAALKEKENTVKGKPVQIQKEAVNKADNTDDEMKKIEASYSKKVRATKDPKEQTRLKEEMEAKMKELKISNQTSAKEDVSNTSVKESKPTTTETNADEKPKSYTEVNKGKPTVAIKNEKISSTKANISNRRKSLDNRKAMVDNANAKVAAARAKLDAAKEEGSLSQEEIAEKEAKIAKAEAQIKKLEASIDKAEKKFDENDSKLSDFGKDKEN